jgi:hypothetical protein
MNIRIPVERVVIKMSVLTLISYAVMGLAAIAGVVVGIIAIVRKMKRQEEAERNGMIPYGGMPMGGVPMGPAPMPVQPAPAPQMNALPMQNQPQSYQFQPQYQNVYQQTGYTWGNVPCTFVTPQVIPYAPDVRSMSHDERYRDAQARKQQEAIQRQQMNAMQQQLNVMQQQMNMYQVPNMNQNTFADYYRSSSEPQWENPFTEEFQRRYHAMGLEEEARKQREQAMFNTPQMPYGYGYGFDQNFQNYGTIGRAPTLEEFNMMSMGQYPYPQYNQQPQMQQQYGYGYNNQTVFQPQMQYDQPQMLEQNQTFTQDQINQFNELMNRVHRGREPRVETYGNVY